MDMRSDPNMTPFMAVTAHWLENSSDGISLCTNLIGFHYVRGNHTGERLADTLLNVTDRLNITNKVSIE